MITKKTKQSEHEKKRFFEKLYWTAFQFFIQIYHTWQTILFDAALLLQKNMMRTGYAEQSIK